MCIQEIYLKIIHSNSKPFEGKVFAPIPVLDCKPKSTTVAQDFRPNPTTMVAKRSFLRLQVKFEKWRLCFVFYYTGASLDQINMDYDTSFLKIKTHPFFMRLPYFREQIPPFNCFRGNYSIYEVKNCHNAETI